MQAAKTFFTQRGPRPIFARKIGKQLKKTADPSSLLNVLKKHILFNTFQSLF